MLFNGLMSFTIKYYFKNNNIFHIFLKIFDYDKDVTCYKSKKILKIGKYQKEAN